MQNWVGELHAHAADDVRLEDGVINVHWGWDRVEGRQPTKSRNRRRVCRSRPRCGSCSSLSCSAPAAVAASAGHQYRANKTWKAAGLKRLTFHDCRHTYASPMIAAGCNANALSTFMGHSSIQITMDRYGHLMPGSEEEAASLLDAYLGRSAAS